jgi:hypothetical protein
MSESKEKFYRYEFPDGFGLWRSDWTHINHDLRELIQELGIKLLTPYQERNGYEFSEIASKTFGVRKGTFWFTARGYRKYKDILDAISTYPEITVRIEPKMRKILWRGASGIQILAIAPGRRKA